MRGNVFNNESINSATFTWGSLQQLVTVGFTTNGQWYLHVSAVTRPSSQAKLRSNEKGNDLKEESDTIFCFVDMFLHFFKKVNHFLFHILFHFKN